jgi:hypothetical protein
MKGLLTLAYLFFLTSIFAETLKDAGGRSIEVEILYIDTNSITVIRNDGEKFDIPISKLSQADQLRLRARAIEPAISEAQAMPATSPDYEKLNTILGINLWSDDNLWDDAPEDVAVRLRWPEESTTANQSSYRVYFETKQLICGAVPYTAVLYGQNRQVDHISIMFANKGDSTSSTLGYNQRKQLKAINDAIDTDSKKIEDVFIPLGEAERQSGGTGNAMKERALRWDVGNTSFWLAAVKDEYLALRIMPIVLADHWGRPEKITNSNSKKMAAANVAVNKFEDVIIENIPMVDQGPKGYCVPATMERCLRYMGIRADMYTLAMAGNTNLGGGTTASGIISGTRKYVRRAGRKMQAISGDISIRKVKSYIDKGQPLLWFLYSTPSYNDLCNTITQKRRKATALEDWKKTLKILLKKTPIPQKNGAYAHICLVVGYNANTDEIAVSDSWGPEYELRWIAEGAAQSVSQDALYIIDF